MTIYFRTMKRILFVECTNWKLVNHLVLGSGKRFLSYFEGYSDQTACLSWWPHQSVFLHSGMWIGYWTPFCKSWFQRHLNEIHEHRAKLRNSMHWAHALEAFGKMTKKLKKANQLASKSFLSSIL